MESPSYFVEEFRGGGAVGFRYAYVGAWLIILSQTYAFTKYFVKYFGMRIRLARWLNMHCTLNVSGFVLVLIHAGFPYAFRYWEPFTRLYVLGGLEGLIGIRGLLTWLLISAFISGMLSRYGSSLRLKRISNRVHFYTALSTYISASIHILLSITFPETR
ncbi:MAG: hypothetical protein QXX80_02880 [Nitrososphaerota archaeon]